VFMIFLTVLVLDVTCQFVHHTHVCRGCS
jgi:hypothetical protein